MRNYKLSFFTMLIAIPLASLLLDTALPYLLSQAIGTFQTSDTEMLSNYLWLAAGVALIGVCLNLLGFQSAIRHEIHVRKDLIHDTVSRLLAKDSDFFADQKIGALTGKFIDFVNAHIGLQDLVIIRTLTFIIFITSGIGIITYSSPLVGLVVSVLIALLLIQVRISLILRRPLRNERKRLTAEINGAAADTITNNLTVKTFAGEAHELTILEQLTEKLRRAYIKDFSWMAAEGSGRLAVMSIFQITAIALIASLLINGEIELGIAVFTIAYLQRVASGLFTLGELINGYDKLFLQAAPMTELLVQDHKIKDSPDAVTLLNPSGEITFENVNYHYADASSVAVINSLNLVIPVGQKIGLVGHSGAGKTTLTKLLLRFSDVSSGNILIDKISLSNISQQSLREAISYVPQEPLLFHRNLRENIAYGKLEATDKEIKEACTQANASEFIERLPDGLNTVVGERGIKLSGGQRQRIAIARAILKDAPILVLDEATSALDSESEKLIQSSLDQLMKGRTSIVIAHRLSTIAKLDRIIVMDNGKIAEDGTHAELLARKGTYAKLWAHQSGGFIEE